MESPKFKAFSVWYSDRVESGKTFQDWVNLPSSDLQCVVIFLEAGYRNIESGVDFYAFDEDMNFSCGDDGSLVHGNVKIGAWTTDENLARIIVEANSSVS